MVRSYRVWEQSFAWFLNFVQYRAFWTEHDVSAVGFITILTRKSGETYRPTEFIPTETAILSHCIGDSVLFGKLGIVFHASDTMACRGSRCIAPNILILGTKWKWLVSFTPLPLYPGNDPRYPLNARPYGPSYWTFRKRVKSLVPTGIRNKINTAIINSRTFSLKWETRIGYYHKYYAYFIRIIILRRN
jgi:hypothetical protein